MMGDFKQVLLLGHFVAVTASFAGTQVPNSIIALKQADMGFLEKINR
jgi:hypothetical protein